MNALVDEPMAKAKKRPPGPVPQKPAQAEVKAQKRSDLLQGHQLYRDLAKWLTEIAAYETEVRKERGELTGREEFKVADLVDPLLRTWAWETVSKIRNERAGMPDAPIPPAPRPLSEEGGS